MQNPTRTRQLKFIGICVGLVIVGWIGWASLRPSPNLMLSVGPAPATVILDGQKHLSTADYHLSTGQHSVKASMNGFVTLTRQFTITKGKTTTIILVLQPNSQTGYDYLKAHPSDEVRWEGLATKNYGIASDNITNNNPIIKSLPYVASDKTFRVDYGAVSGSKTKIYITAVDDNAANSARLWIEGKGFNPSSLLLQTTLEPLLTHLPYKTTDYSLTASYGSGSNGQPILQVDAVIRMAAADAGSPDAVNRYKQEVIDYINSCGVNATSYVINYTVQNA